MKNEFFRVVFFAGILLFTVLTGGCLYDGERETGLRTGMSLVPTYIQPAGFQPTPAALSTQCCHDWILQYKWKEQVRIPEKKQLFRAVFSGFGSAQDTFLFSANSEEIIVNYDIKAPQNSSFVTLALVGIGQIYNLLPSDFRDTFMEDAINYFILVPEDCKYKSKEEIMADASRTDQQKAAIIELIEKYDSSYNKAYGILMGSVSKIKETMNKTEWTLTLRNRENTTGVRYFTIDGLKTANTIPQESIYSALNCLNIYMFTVSADVFAATEYVRKKRKERYEDENKDHPEKNAYVNVTVTCYTNPKTVKSDYYSMTLAYGSLPADPVSNTEYMLISGVAQPAVSEIPAFNPGAECVEMKVECRDSLKLIGSVPAHSVPYVLAADKDELINRLRAKFKTQDSAEFKRDFSTCLLNNEGAAPACARTAVFEKPYSFIEKMRIRKAIFSKVPRIGGMNIRVEAAANSINVNSLNALLGTDAGN